MRHEFFPIRLPLVCLLLILFIQVPLLGQFKKVFDADSVTLLPPSLFSAAKVLETDIPGKEILILGSLTTQDTSGAFHLATFDLFANLHGIPQTMHMFEDTSAFVFQGPKTYGGCYAGNGEFYLATGTNGNQVVIKGNEGGQVLWARRQRHHEFYSLHCDQSKVLVLGQDESIQGVHDFSLLSLNADGSFNKANLFGTPEYEAPQRLLKVGTDYLMVGSHFVSGGFKLFVVKADSGLNLVWGRVLDLPGKIAFGYGLVQPLDGNGYMVSGTARGGVDSLYLLKLDDAGLPVWSRYFAIQGATEATNYSLAMDPETGGYLLAGSYRKTGYLRPFIFKTDSLGNVEWSFDYGDPGVNTDEILNDIIYCQADSHFYSVGDMVQVDSNQYFHKVILIKIAADSGEIPCDSVLQVNSGSLVFQPSTNAIEEAFQVSSPYPIGNLYPLNLNVEVRCSVIVIVGNAEGLPLTGIFHFTNPSAGQLKLKAEVPLGGGTLRVHSLAGTLLLESPVAEGLHEEIYELAGLSNGLYVVSLEGPGWRYPTRRWAIQK